MTDEIKNSAAEAAEEPQDGENNVLSIDAQVRDKAPQRGAQAATDKGPKGSYTHEFKKPFAYEEKTYKTLTFYWDRLTGHDMISIENEMQAMNEYALSPEISASFLCRMAAKAAGVGSDVLEHLPIGEFSKIKNATRDFLIASGY